MWSQRVGHDWAHKKCLIKDKGPRICLITHGSPGGPWQCEVIVGAQESTECTRIMVSIYFRKKATAFGELAWGEQCASMFTTSENMNQKMQFLLCAHCHLLNKWFSSIQSLSHVGLFATSLSITNSWSLIKLMFIELVMLSNHLILCRPLLLLPSILPSIRVNCFNMCKDLGMILTTTKIDELIIFNFFILNMCLCVEAFPKTFKYLCYPMKCMLFCVES